MIVLGAGPAGAATAIALAQRRLRVSLLERAAFPRPCPGESLHPGVEPLLERLGVGGHVQAAGFVRYAGHWIQRAGCSPRFQPFGQDGSGPWLGFQVHRPTFDAILLNEARRLGVQVFEPTKVLGLERLATWRGAHRISIETSSGLISARFVVDATGRRHWLADQLGLSWTQVGPDRHACYGYMRGRCPARDVAPAIIQDDTGWTWTARVGDGLYQWTRLSWGTNGRDDRVPPDEFRGLTPCGPTQGADVSWRIVDSPAGHGYFIVGDAASVLDPASSHGILKALMSGMMAAHLITAVTCNQIDERLAIASYSRWIRSWFDHDAAMLSNAYGALPRVEPPRPIEPALP